MHSLTQEIESFSKARLKKQCTRVTSLSGRRIIETWKGSTVHVVEDVAQPQTPCGYVHDNSWDLQVGQVKPYLLLGSQDAAHDFGTLRKHKVSHVLNVAYGVENAFPDLFIYKSLSILDQPDTDITAYLPDCSRFIDQAHAEKGVVLVHCSARMLRAKSIVIGYLMFWDRRLICGEKQNKGVVLVHCNGGISRAASIVIGYLMYREGQPFDQAFAAVKSARPMICPNPCFLEQLRSFTPVRVRGQVNGANHA